MGKIIDGKAIAAGLYEEMQREVEQYGEQYGRRRALSTRQAMALRRVVMAYADKIPDFAKRSVGLGLEGVLPAGVKPPKRTRRVTH